MERVIRLPTGQMSRVIDLVDDCEYYDIVLFDHDELAAFQEAERILQMARDENLGRRKTKKRLKRNDELCESAMKWITRKKK